MSITYIYMVNLWRHDNLKISRHEVAKKTASFVILRVYPDKWDIEDGVVDPWESRFRLVSRDHKFFDTTEEAEAFVVETSIERIEHYDGIVSALKKRLQEVCKHVAITGPSDERCTVCNFKVPNPDDYCNGG